MQIYPLLHDNPHGKNDREYFRAVSCNRAMSPSVGVSRLEYAYRQTERQTDGNAIPIAERLLCTLAKITDIIIIITSVSETIRKPPLVKA